MTDPRVKLARYTRDILSHSEDLIRVGRRNWTRDNFDADYIVIDNSISTKVSTCKQFDGDNGQEKITDTYSSTFTVNFYGINAFDLSHRWARLLKSQAGQELQHTNLIEIKNPSQIINVAALTGSDYSDSYQINITVWYNSSDNVATESLVSLEVGLKVDNNGQIINETIEVN